MQCVRRTLLLDVFNEFFIKNFQLLTSSNIVSSYIFPRPKFICNFYENFELKFKTIKFNINKRIINCSNRIYRLYDGYVNLIFSSKIGKISSNFHLRKIIVLIEEEIDRDIIE